MKHFNTKLYSLQASDLQPWKPDKKLHQSVKANLYNRIN